MAAAASSLPSVLLVLAAAAMRTGNPFLLEGSSSSYAQFRRWLPASSSSSADGDGSPSPISFEFLTSQPNGVLLYTDDGGYYDFLELKLVDGAVRLRFSFDQGDARALQAGSGLADGERWHRVSVARRGDVVTLAVDGETASAALRAPAGGAAAHRFGSANATGNSYVYVGGLPAWFEAKLSALALPSVVFEPRFRGAIRYCKRLC